jgi:HemY protein
MAKFVLFLILLVPLIAAGNWLLAHPGVITLDWLGYEVTVHIALAALILALICLAIAMVVVVTWHILTWPERRRARRRYRTLARGLRQLTHGVTALALGDDKAAQVALKRAAEALPGEPLPQLLTAQLLQRRGQHEAARKELRALMKHEATAQLAAHRLIEQHLEDKEWAQALTLAEQLRAEEPNDRWLILTLIDLYSRQQHYAEILKLTEGWKFKSPLSREERHRYAAIAYLLMARAKDDARAKLTALRHATGYAPDFLPAVTAYAELLLTDGEQRQARKLLRQLWLKTPDSSLITPILDTLANESPRTQTRLLGAFLYDGNLPLQYQLEAAHAMQLNRPGEAAAALEKALLLQETKDVFARMAEVQKKLHGDDAANRYLARAMDAPIGIGWICQRCGTNHESWQLHCSGCDAFDTLHHETPEARITSVE